MSKIELVRGSCADQKADVVVNAANRYLLGGSGICGVIFSKAGDKDLAMACCKYMTPLEDGAAVITPSFNLKNFKAIIHAVGPNFNNTCIIFFAAHLFSNRQLIIQEALEIKIGYWMQ